MAEKQVIPARMSATAAGAARGGLMDYYIHAEIEAGPFSDEAYKFQLVLRQRTKVAHVKFAAAFAAGVKYGIDRR